MYEKKGCHLSRILACCCGFMLLWQTMGCDQKTSETATSLSSYPPGIFVAWLEKQKSFSVDVRVTRYPDPESSLTMPLGEFTVIMKRPNKHLIVSKNSASKDLQVCDGKKITVYDGVRKEYWRYDASTPAPNHIRLGSLGLVTQYLAEDFIANLLSSGAAKVSSEEDVAVKGERLFHVTASIDPLVQEFWFDRTPEAHLRKVKLSCSDGFPSTMVSVLEFSNWIAGPPAPSDLFTFTPPDGSKKVDRPLGSSGSDPATPFSFPQGAELLWSYPRDGVTIAGDCGGKGLLTISFSGDVAILGPDGTLLSKAKGPYQSELCALSIDNLERKEGVFFSASRSLPTKIVASDLSGKKLWEYKYRFGHTLTSMAFGYGDGDLPDSLILATSGRKGGIRAIGDRGTALWEAEYEYSLDDAQTSDLNGDGVSEVMALAYKSLDVYDMSGTKSDTIALPFAADTTRAFGFSNEERPSTLCLDFEDGVMSAYNCRTKDQWKINLPGLTMPTISIVSATGRPWLALATLEGGIYVVDVEKRRVVVNARAGRRIPSVAWLESPEYTSPRLVFTAEKDIRCYSLEAHATGEPMLRHLTEKPL